MRVILDITWRRQLQYGQSTACMLKHKHAHTHAEQLVACWCRRELLCSWTGSFRFNNF